MKPENQLILITAINSLCQEMENRLNSDPLPGPNNPMYTSALNTTTEALTATVQHLFQRHNLTLPPNWTYAQIVADILGDEMTLGNVASVLSNITKLGLASNEFHQIFNLLNLTSGGFS
ncbi:Uncharacterized protein Fot_56452 [Forsythia ovata]|uniref:Uncharacterized protein n=1 Tax=Forsythia ovata TaxID=205694 RepID=A0ABD1NZP5_9LAMI